MSDEKKNFLEFQSLDNPNLQQRRLFFEHARIEIEKKEVPGFYEFLHGCVFPSHCFWGHVMAHVFGHPWLVSTFLNYQPGARAFFNSFYRYVKSEGLKNIYPLPYDFVTFAKFLFVENIQEPFDANGVFQPQQFWKTFVQLFQYQDVVLNASQNPFAAAWTPIDVQKTLKTNQLSSKTAAVTFLPDKSTNFAIIQDEQKACVEAQFWTNSDPKFTFGHLQKCLPTVSHDQTRLLVTLATKKEYETVVLSLDKDGSYSTLAVVQDPKRKTPTFQRKPITTAYDSYPVLLVSRANRTVESILEIVKSEHTDAPITQVPSFSWLRVDPNWSFLSKWKSVLYMCSLVGTRNFNMEKAKEKLPNLTAFLDRMHKNSRTLSKDLDDLKTGPVGLLYVNMAVQVFEEHSPKTLDESCLVFLVNDMDVYVKPEPEDRKSIPVTEFFYFLWEFVAFFLFPEFGHDEFSL